VPIPAGPGPGAAAGITANDWVNAVRRHCSTFHREERNTLAGAGVDNLGTTLTFSTALGGIVPQALIEIDSELCYVQAINPSGMSATVIRASEGSVAAAHASGATVTVNPRFPVFAIFTALNDVLRDVSGSNFFQMKAVTIVFNASVFGYDLTDSDVLDVYDVRIKRSGTTAMWDRVDNFTLHRNMDPAEFASTNALFLYQVPATNGQPLRVLYKAPFTQLTALTDDVLLTGLGSTAYDLPPLGAAVRMLAGREVKRNFTENAAEARRATEVPPGAVLGSMRGLQVLFDTRFKSEVKSLLSQYPPLTRLYTAHPFGSHGLVS